MIDKSSFMPLNFFKKTDYHGSLSGLRFRIGKELAPYSEEELAARKEKGEEAAADGGTTVLRARIWEGPFAYGKHDASTEYAQDFPFSEEGIHLAVDWINGEYDRDRDRWDNVPFWTPEMSRKWERDQ